MRHAAGMMMLVRALPHALLSLLVVDMHGLVHMQSYSACHLQDGTEAANSASLCAQGLFVKTKHTTPIG